MSTVPLYVATLMESVARVEGKLDTFIDQMKVQDARSTGHEVRLRKVENKQTWYAGAGSALGVIAGVLSTALFGVHVR